MLLCWDDQAIWGGAAMDAFFDALISNGPEAALAAENRIFENLPTRSAYGVLGVSDPRPVIVDTVFEIGSATKVFTSLLLADMAQRGEVRPDDLVATHLPEDFPVPQFGGTPITLLDLATPYVRPPIVPVSGYCTILGEQEFDSGTG